MASSSNPQNGRARPVSQQSGPPGKSASARSTSSKSGLVGHTCAWKVEEHLSRPAFRALKNFCQLSPSLEATIRRKQLEIAVRKASASTGRRLRLVRRDVVDATAEKPSKLPVIGRADKTYRLEPGRMNAAGTGGVYAALKRLYKAESGTIHTTVVASIVKRYVRRRLAGFSLRDHGGVYFVSAKREDKLFALADFLSGRGIGHITRFGVGGSGHERAVLSEEIRRITQGQIDALREAFEESDLSSARDRARLRGKVKAEREELREMRRLFGFAGEVLAETDAEARGLMKRIVRGERQVNGGDLFADSEALSGAGSGASPGAEESADTPRVGAEPGAQDPAGGDGAAAEPAAFAGDKPRRSGLSASVRSPATG